MPTTHLRRAAAAVLAVATALTFTAGPAEAARPLAARNLPADGRVLFYLGQDSTTLNDFRTGVHGFPEPAGVTLYTNLVGAPMSGMFQPTNYGSGENNFPQTINQYGGGLAVGLYLSDPAQTPLKAYAGTADAATNARYRKWLDEFIAYLSLTGRDVFVRIGYEFDGSWNAYDQSLYKQAYRYIADRIHRIGAHRLATVWQSAAWPRVTPAPYDATNPTHWDDWYPGDQYVDWAGMSYFYGTEFLKYQWSCEKPENIAAPASQVQNSFLDFARKHRKPVFVSESAPQGFDNGNLTAKCIFAGGPAAVPVTAQQIWDTWYAPYFRFIAQNRDIVRGVSYINTNWNSQSMWQCTDAACPNGYWGDSRIQADPLIFARFRAEISQPMYAKGPRTVCRFEPPNFSGPGRSEAEFADLPQGGATGIAIADTTASNDRTALIYANGAALEFDHVAAGPRVTLRYATTTDNVHLTMLVNGKAAAPVTLPNRGSATAWADAAVPIAVPRDATIEVRLDSGDVVWIDYLTPGQQRGSLSD